MKTIMSFFIFVFSMSSFASMSTLKCSLESNPNKTALVAGKSFEIMTDSNFGYNGFYQHKVIIQSEYLGTCEGDAAENKNPLAEGYGGAVTVTGPKCAADGFDIYMSPGFEGVVQINSDEDAIYYNCSKK